jgi:hypothetical protein
MRQAMGDAPSAPSGQSSTLAPIPDGFQIQGQRPQARGAISFDDLIPPKGSSTSTPQTPLSFDDLIPAHGGQSQATGNIEVEGPDGTIHEFPDGTSPDVIKRAMVAHYGAPKADPWAQFTPARANSDPWAQFTPASAAPISTGEDVAKSGAAGVAKGALGLAMMPGDISRAIDYLPTYLAAKAAEWAHLLPAGKTASDLMNDAQALDLPRDKFAPPTSGDIQKVIEQDVTGPWHQPQTKAGHYAEAVGSFLPGASLIPTASKVEMLANALRYGAAPGIGSEAAGEATQGTAAEPWARLAGGLAGVAALPMAGAAAGSLLGGPASSIRAMWNPSGVADSQLARTIMESKKAPGDLSQSVADAAAAGQPMFTVADALGNAGQRALAGAARANGEGRTMAVNFLDNRQAGQGRRVASQLADALEAPDTAAARESALTAQRSADADVNYGAARAGAGAVNVTPAIEAADKTLTPGTMSIMDPASGIADNSIEAVVRRAKSYLTNGRENLSDFNQVKQAKEEIQNLIETGSPTQQRALIPIKQALDDQLAASSPDYAAARDTFRRQSQEVEAVGKGKSAASRGRSEDTIPLFNGMQPGEQSAFRAGYADPLIEQIQRDRVGANKVATLLADGPAAELQAFSAPGRAQMLADQLARENTMFETRAAATGGSKTDMNLGDARALEIDPSILGHLLQGNFPRAAMSVARGIGNGLTGNTAAVREQLANRLLQHGGAPDLSGAASLVSKAEARTRALSMARALAAEHGVAGLPPSSR